jgi:hypothetical protein
MSELLLALEVLGHDIQARMNTYRRFIASADRCGEVAYVQELQRLP